MYRTHLPSQKNTPSDKGDGVFAVLEVGRAKSHTQFIIKTRGLDTSVQSLATPTHALWFLRFLTPLDHNSIY